MKRLIFTILLILIFWYAPVHAQMPFPGWGVVKAVPAGSPTYSYTVASHDGQAYTDGNPSFDRVVCGKTGNVTKIGLHAHDYEGTATVKVALFTLSGSTITRVHSGTTITVATADAWTDSDTLASPYSCTLNDVLYIGKVGLATEGSRTLLDVLSGQTSGNMVYADPAKTYADFPEASYATAAYTDVTWARILQE